MTTRKNLWSATHAERAALAEDLARLDDAQWQSRSLCDEWTVEQAVAHLTAGASVGRLGWLVSVVGARVDFDLHNARLLEKHRGPTPADTLAKFRSVITSTTSAPGPTVAWLGEVIVHSQDIRRPLGLHHPVPLEAASAVAEFYATGGVATPIRSTIRGLRVEATDSPFGVGEGPLVRGTTLALLMAIAGRGVYCDELAGPGVSTVRERCSARS